jgi:hypothetical protein
MKGKIDWLLVTITFGGLYLLGHLIAFIWRQVC